MKGLSRLLGALRRGLPKREVLRQTYEIAYIAHTPLEPRAAVAEWSGDKQDIMFVTSTDLLHWTKVDEKHLFAQDREPVGVVGALLVLDSRGAVREQDQIGVDREHVGIGQLEVGDVSEMPECEPEDDEQRGDGAGYSGAKAVARKRVVRQLLERKAN